jgi:hypothetical protein
MLQHDLKVAGIPYVDDNGLYADFHALRHTFITNMVKAGIAPKAAQSLARHSTIDLTMNVYTTLTVHDQASALASLPPIPAFGRSGLGNDSLRATGTDGPKKVPTVVPRGAENGAVRLASEASQLARDCTENGETKGAASRPENAKSPVEIGVSCTTLHDLASSCDRMPKVGLEPTPTCVDRILSPARLPFRHFGAR